MESLKKKILVRSSGKILKDVFGGIHREAIIITAGWIPKAKSILVEPFEELLNIIRNIFDGISGEKHGGIIKEILGWNVAEIFEAVSWAIV